MGFKKLGSRFNLEPLYDAKGNGVGRTFNPYSDANDRNKVIEKMRISSWILYNAGNWIWEAFTHDDKYKAKDKSMEAAQIACISKVLEDR